MAAAAEVKKIIIDTDPGIEDAMAIFLALRSPEVEVIGLTTIYGNVYTALATRNALHLTGLISPWPKDHMLPSLVILLKLMNSFTPRTVQNLVLLILSMVPMDLAIKISLHRKESLLAMSAPDFLIEQANLYPGKAIQQDPSFVKNIGQIVLLGGAFAVNGNANPAAEANVSFSSLRCCRYCVTSGANILAVGINVTHQVVLTEADRDKLASSTGTFALYLCKILGVYFNYHNEAYSTKGVYLHDPTAMLASINPSLLTYTEGSVRVQRNGITGLTLLYNKQKSCWMNLYKVNGIDSILYETLVLCINVRTGIVDTFDQVCRNHGVDRSTFGEGGGHSRWTSVLKLVMERLMD
ncbi:putative uridine nucleosidase 2 [Hibiscus syriacus]|uniref:Uridine nucleosidase 2 n=1 Tax=Hibiscus syriacus TaxID=106335 RepID=A0A6A2WMF0_HIBSY|nr:putative uridine nucleosidase 2 [Hibiscus syriacus]